MIRDCAIGAGVLVVVAALTLPLWTPLLAAEQAEDAAFRDLYVSLRAAGTGWDRELVRGMSRADALVYLTALRDGVEPPAPEFVEPEPPSGLNDLLNAATERRQAAKKDVRRLSESYKFKSFIQGQKIERDAR